MALSADIYGAVGRGVRSVADYDAEAQAAKANKLSLLMQQQQFDDYGRVRADENALRQVYASFGTDDAANVNALYRAGRGQQAQAYQKAVLEGQKTQGEIGKTKAETGAKQLESKIKATEFHAQRVSGITDPAQVRAWVDEGVATGVFDKEGSDRGYAMFMDRVAKVGLEAAKAESLNLGRSATEQLKASFEEAQEKERVRQFGVTSTETATNNARTDARIRSEGAANRGVTMRGQNITERAALQGGSVQVDGAGNMVVVPNKIVPGMPTQVSPVMGADGKPVQGSKGAGGQPTEDERKSAGYAIRMEGALKKLAEVGKANPDALKPGLGTTALNMLPEGAANYMRSEPRQRVETAQLDALDAALTLATGAAYTKEQLKGLSRSYFAQPGDGATAIADKDARLKEVIETARIRAGRAAPTIAQVSGKSTPGIPDMSAIDAELAKRK